MKQQAEENVYFVLICLATLFFGLASAVMLIRLRPLDYTLFVFYSIFASLWGAGFVFALVAKSTHLSVFWGLSFAFDWSYFALFSVTMGTVFQAATGILDASSNTGRIAGYAVGITACVSVIIGFLALFLRKKWLIIASLLLVILLTFFYAVEFGWQCFASYGQGRSGVDFAFASISSAVASMILCLASIILMIQEIGQIDAEPDNLKKIIDEAVEGGKKKQ